MAETDSCLEKSLPNMEVEEVTKPGSEDQVEVPSLGQSQDTIERVIEESKSESQTNGTEAASAGKSAKSPVEQEDKTRKEPEKESPSQDGPSKRVREGQKWNDRPRKQYGNPNDRPHKRHNNKSDLVSQQESSDPVAIRKQVCNSPMLYNFIKTDRHTQGRVLLLRLQPSDRQIPVHKSRRP